MKRILGMSWWEPVIPAIRPDGYHWWTCNASREHVKFGPVAVSWYRWPNTERHVDVSVLCRWTLTIPAYRTI